MELALVLVALFSGCFLAGSVTAPNAGPTVPFLVCPGSGTC